MPEEPTVRQQLLVVADKCLEDLEGLEQDVWSYGDDLSPREAGDTWVVLRMVIRRLQSVEGLVEPARGG